MLRPSPVLTPPSANGSPTAFRYAPAHSPPPPSPRSTAPPAAPIGTPTRSAATASLASSPRLIASPRSRNRARSLATMAVSDTIVGPSSAATPSTPSTPASDAKIATTRMHGQQSGPVAADDGSATAGAKQHTAAPPTSQRSLSDATSNGSALTHASPSKRRGEEIESHAAMSQPAASQGDSTQPAKRARPDEQPPKVLPARYELCPVDDMVELISHMLNELIATNDAIRTTSGGLTRFHSRLAKHATLIPPLLLSMVYYIDRLCALYPEFTINTLTVHRFLITAATVAAKGLSDAFWNNTTYARVGGVRLAELKMLELEFLYRVDWRIVPNPEVLVAYYRGLVERTPGYVLEGEGSDDMDNGVPKSDGNGE
ncbi:cyclin-dependent protein kinase regulator Pho80 [Cordyceps fumosorosea ARSEF 2679]|uniref:Cyclin-dependent protein kinase regulator Pho80 n=1 Tax=Cordyceps fumosorosea (strain ARSEF 2679) TaxID=1081104 RepID=A0A168CB62_CORFA|nr:cyclin-dependent protein kinase regulator Pho80 [Cordyceps fumosorosea ARSEF 2679]OAA71178.1 cyclin-dependent protein kinase regulator Pho80 [Cordyceps fumosorosea ARSEF 2679]